MQKTPDGTGWISTSDPKRETLGTQIVKAEESYDGYTQEVGETMDELGKTICKGLEEAINNARSKGISGRIYIMIVESPMPPGVNTKPILQLTFFTRATRPDPEWNTCLYSHDDDAPYPKLEWSLPQFQHVQRMLCDPKAYTPEQLNWIKLMCQGLLI